MQNKVSMLTFQGAFNHQYQATISNKILVVFKQENTVLVFTQERSEFLKAKGCCFTWNELDLKNLTSLLQPFFYTLTDINI